MVQFLEGRLLGLEVGCFISSLKTRLSVEYHHRGFLAPNKAPFVGKEMVTDVGGVNVHTKFMPTGVTINSEHYIKML